MKELQDGQLVSHSKTGNKRKPRLLNNIIGQCINNYPLSVEYGDGNYYYNLIGNLLHINLNIIFN